MSLGVLFLPIAALLGCEITESLRLERTIKTIWSNPNPCPPCPSVPRVIETDELTPARLPCAAGYEVALGSRIALNILSALIWDCNVNAVPNAVIPCSFVGSSCFHCSVVLRGTVHSVAGCFPSHPVSAEGIRGSPAAPTHPPPLSRQQQLS